MTVDLAQWAEEHFEGVRGSGDRFVALCPAPVDRAYPSVSGRTTESCFIATRDAPSRPFLMPPAWTGRISINGLIPARTHQRGGNSELNSVKRRADFGTGSMATC